MIVYLDFRVSGRFHALNGQLNAMAGFEDVRYHSQVDIISYIFPA